MPIKVLIADDDVALLTSLSVRLRSEGYEVFCVQDSYQAVEQSGRFKPDVLVLDINMPAGDGFTVQERLHKRSEFGTTPVIYLTGERSDRVTGMAKSLGAFAILFKPCETKELLDAIASAAERETSREAA